MGDAQPLTLDTRACSPEGKALIAAVFGEVRYSPAADKIYRRAGKRLEKYRLAVEALLAGVLLNAARCGRREWSYQLLSSDPFTGQAVPKRAFDDGLAALRRARLIEVREAFTKFDASGGKERFATRFRATPKLLALCAVHGVTLPDPPKATWSDHFHRVRPKKAPEPISMRKLSKWEGGDKIRGAPLPIPEGRPADVARQSVFDANAFIRRFTIAGCDPVIFTRRYTEDLQGQGRWYASHSSIPKEDRKDLRIEGERVVEVDVTASLLTVLHGQLGRPLPDREDLYGGLGFPRAVVKLWVNGTIGAGKPVEAWSPKMEEEARKRGVMLAEYPCGEVAAAVLAAYPLLGDPSAVNRPGDDIRMCSQRLMWWEAVALTLAMEALREKDIPALPLHDALIVRERDREAAADALRWGYRHCLGVTPRVK